MRYLRFLIAAIVVSLALSALALAQESSILAITGGTVLDVRTGEKVINATILVEDDTIIEVGSSSEVDVPPSAKRIDARNKVILPGLIEMHTHVTGYGGLLPLDLFLAKGVTTVRDVGGNVTELKLLRDNLSSGDTEGPRLFFCGPILDGNPPLWPEDSFIVDTPKRARSAVQFLADQDVDCIKVYNSITEQVLEAIVDEASVRRLPVIGHVPRTMTMTGAVTTGLRGLEHVRITGKELLSQEEAAQIDVMPYAKRETLLWQRFDLESEPMRRLVQLLVDSKVFLDPTLVVAEDTFVLDTSEQMGHPDNRHLPDELYAAWKAEWTEFLENSEVMTVPPELKEAAILGFEKRKGFVGMCARAGVTIVAGTDGPSFGTLLPGFAIHRELQMLVDAGLTSLQAIQAATVNAAQAIGQENTLGTVEPGKWADLLILDGDPLADIKKIATIRWVIQGGKIYEPSRILHENF